MGWRMRKRFKIAPGVNLNVSNKGVGISVGGPLGRLSVSPTKRVTFSQSIPGTGLYRSEVISRSSSSRRKKSQPPVITNGKSRGGCGRWLLYGVIGFVVLAFCGALANIVAPDAAPAEESARSAAVALPTWTVTSQPTEIPTAEPQATATSLPTDVSRPSVVESQPTTTPLPTNTAFPPTIEPTATSLPTDTPVLTYTPLPTDTALPTDTPLPPMATPPPTVTESAPSGPMANTEANVREGPGTAYAVVTVAQPGQSMVVTGKDSSGEWLQLASGYWIAASLVDNAPADLPIAAPVAQPPGSNPTSAAQEVVTAPTLDVAQRFEPAAPAANPFRCEGGCAVAPDPSCAIKGNVNSKGERIYHTPSSNSYNNTDVKPEEGDRWFCTEAEAQAAGFRAPRN